MLLCPSFSFNHYLYTTFDYKRMFIMWKHIENKLEEMCMNKVVNRSFVTRILNNRSSMRFQSLFSISGATNVPIEAIDRNKRLQNRFNGTYEIHYNRSHVGTIDEKVFQSYESMVRFHIDYFRFPYSCASVEPICNCNILVNCRIPKSDIRFTMCLKHPFVHLQEVLIEIANTFVILHGDQVRHPLEYLDRRLLLPDIFRESIHEMLLSIDKSTIKGVYLNNQNTITAYPSRQCIRLGGVFTENITVLLSCIRPTLNFFKCIATIAISEKSAFVTHLKGQCMKSTMMLGDKLELRFSFKEISDTHYEVEITGEHTYLLLEPFSKRDNRLRIKNVSMGACCLQLTVIEDSHFDEQQITSIEPTMKFFKYRTSFNPKHFPLIGRRVENNTVCS